MHTHIWITEQSKLYCKVLDKVKTSKDMADLVYISTEFGNKLVLSSEVKLIQDGERKV